MQRSRVGPQKTKPATDLTRWRLSCVEGHQSWHYFEKEDDVPRKQNMIEKHAVGLDTSEEAPPLPKAEKAQDAAINGMKFYAKLQAEDGHWPEDWSGILFLLPTFVAANYITKTPFTNAERLELIRYMKSVMCPDGGWGLHIFGPASAYGSILNYCAMRMLGVPDDDADLVKTRSLIHKLGGAVVVSTWGKILLAIMNLYSWEGVNSLFPELWLFPSWLPFHPSKMYCHPRHVFLALSYCFGRRIVAQEDDLIRQLRTEIFVEDFHTIKWTSHRNNVSSLDLLTPHSWILDLTYFALNIYEKFPIRCLRKRALGFIYDQIVAEDRHTDCINLSPMSTHLHMLIQYHEEGPLCKYFLRHQIVQKEYLWLGVDGMKVKTTHGCQLWVTTLSTLAFEEAGACTMSEFHPCLMAAYKFTRLNQISEELPNHQKYYRDRIKGGFSFATKKMNWPGSDTTAEAIKAILNVEQNAHVFKPIPKERLFQGIDVILNMQSCDCGWPPYEVARGGHFLKMLCAIEIFENIMVHDSTVECTSSCMQCLVSFRKLYPQYRSDEINKALHKAMSFIKKRQRPDGSWIPDWGFYFTYGAWFALEAYSCMGHTYDSGTGVPDAVRKGCEYLLSKQMDDGGWGENFESCEVKEYVNSETSLVVQTCWAVLGLLAVNYPDLDVLERGIQVIMSRQLSNGDWPQESINGMANKRTPLHYDTYRNIFPIWTLGRFAHIHPESKLVKS